MRGEDFDRVRSLLPAIEDLVLVGHRSRYPEGWSRPAAYRWMRYENPDPIGRLAAAAEILGIDEAPTELVKAARRLGFPGT